MGDVVERLKGDAAGESGITRQTNDVLLAAPHVPRGGHAEGSRQGRSGVAGAKTVVLALGTQHEAVEPAGLPNGVEPIPPAREQLVDVGLMADVKKKVIRRRVEHPVQGDGQLHHTQIGPEVAAGLAQDTDEFLADLLREPRKIFHRELFDVLGTFDGIQQTGSHKSRLDKQVGVGSTSLLCLGPGLPIFQLPLPYRSIFPLGQQRDPLFRGLQFFRAGRHQFHARLILLHDGLQRQFRRLHLLH